MSSLNDVYYELSEMDDRISEARAALEGVASCSDSLEGYVDDLVADSNHLFKLKAVLSDLLRQVEYREDPTVTLIREYLNLVLSIMDRMSNGETVTVRDDEALRTVLVSMELEDVSSK